MAQMTVTIPDEYFLQRLESYYGAMILQYPSFSNFQGIRFWYAVPLAMVAKMARHWFFKEVQGKDPFVDEDGILKCYNCKTPIDKEDVYCKHCGFKINWKFTAIFKRDHNQVKNNDAWQDLENQPPADPNKAPNPPYEKLLRTKKGREALKQAREEANTGKGEQPIDRNANKKKPKK